MVEFSGLSTHHGVACTKTLNVKFISAKVTPSAFELSFAI
jgi:hypothetical protein